MHPRARIIILLVLVAVLIGGGYWLLQESAQARNGTLTGTGTIEAEPVTPPSRPVCNVCRIP